jgi:hypothetical protein
MCAMRVHLMNESEMNVFCPAEAKVPVLSCLSLASLLISVLCVGCCVGVP